MNFLDLFIASFCVALGAGLAVLFSVMFIYYFNYIYDQWRERKLREQEAKELQERLKQYGEKSTVEEFDEEIEYEY
jgi:CHASE1-domain containing sensor protein